MNQREVVKIEGPFEAAALRILRETPGITVIAHDPKHKEDHWTDAIIRFSGKRASVAVEFKRRVNAATAWQLLQSAKTLRRTPLLLIAGETTAEARQILHNHGVGVVDELGNAHIRVPGLFFHIEGHRSRRRLEADKPPTRLNGKAGVAIQALLLQPKRAWQVQEVAKEAKISAGFAHRILARLETEGIVAAAGSGPNRVRRVTNPTALLDLYAEENVSMPVRTPGYLLAQTPHQLIKQVAANLEGTGIKYALTGAAAASQIAPFVTAIPVTEVWVAEMTAAQELYKASHAEPVKEGSNLVFLQGKGDASLVFREKTMDLWTVNRFQLYADLRRDPRRGKEQADHLRREVIGF